MISALLQNAQSLIDLFWVGRLGSDAVAALAVSGTVLMALFPMVMGMSIITRVCFIAYGRALFSAPRSDSINPRLVIVAPETNGT